MTFPGGAGLTAIEKYSTNPEFAASESPYFTPSLFATTLATSVGKFWRWRLAPLTIDFQVAAVG